LPREKSQFRVPLVFGLKCFARSLVYQGLMADYRGEYWRYLWRVLRRSPWRFPAAIRLAIQGEHMIRYTDEEVLPRLRIDIEKARLTPRPWLTPTPLPDSAPECRKRHRKTVHAS